MPYTMQSYQDEVTLRLARYSVSQELDPGTLEMCINDARRDVQQATMGLFPERYAAIIRLDAVTPTTATEITRQRKTVTRLGVSNIVRWVEYPLPADYIQESAVNIKETGGGWWAARKVTKQELYQGSRNSWVIPTKREPMYYIEKNPANANYVIGVSNGDNIIKPEEVEVWYNRALKYLQSYNAALPPGNDMSDPEVVMSYEFEELVIYQAMLDCLKKMNFADETVQQMIGTEMEQVVGSYAENFNTNVDRSYLLLPSNEGLYPNQPIMQTPQNGFNPMLPPQGGR